jgi:hypothetical protein
VKREKLKVPVRLYDGPKIADAEAEAVDGAVRLQIAHLGVCVIANLEVEGARQLASLLLDAASDAAGQRPREGVSP